MRLIPSVFNRWSNFLGLGGRPLLRSLWFSTGGSTLFLCGIFGFLLPLTVVQAAGAPESRVEGRSSQAGTFANFWPWEVLWESDDSTRRRSERLGPIWESRSLAGQQEMRALRPFWLNYQRPEKSRAPLSETYIVPPIFSRRTYANNDVWSLTPLVRRARYGTPEDPREFRFEVIPFLFYREHLRSPERNYFGLFPVFGEVKDRLFHDRISWAAFPLYASFEKRGHRHYAAPWPFVRWMTGENASGFAVWPLFGSYQEDGFRDYRYALWPLAYHLRQYRSGELHRERMGFLPFYTRDSGPEFESRGYLWPFFGYREDTGQTPYRETLYFWPFIVQGRGEERSENRIMPFYGHWQRPTGSTRWVAWPLWYERHEVMPRVEERLTRLGLFIWWDLRQTHPGHPEGPMARKTHLWPLFSRWDSGGGTRQWQVFSPLESLFPLNQTVRDLYSPLFALYRYEEHEPESIERHRFLFSLLTYERNEEGTQFDLGPLLRVSTGSDDHGFSLLRGFFSRHRYGENVRYRLLWMNLSGDSTE